MIGHTIDLKGGFDAALERVTGALANEGLGVITRIDMDKTFEQKLGEEFRRYVIHGACNPQPAKKAVFNAPEIGLLLPCNVTVRDAGAKLDRVANALAIDLRPEVRTD